MAAEQVLQLYDSCWFELPIFTNKQTKSLPVVGQSQELNLSRIRSLDVRSQSLHCLCSETNFSPASPNSVIVPPKLQAALSGKEETSPMAMRRKKSEKQRRNKKGSRSLSNLEFEELKGFMDLGFVFCEEDKDSSLVSILPGLQRYGRKGGEEVVSDDTHQHKVSRPYLSEAWGVSDRIKVTNPLIKWRFPDPRGGGGGIDMKNHLRVWARSVASTVK